MNGIKAYFLKSKYLHLTQILMGLFKGISFLYQQEKNLYNLSPLNIKF